MQHVVCIPARYTISSEESRPMSFPGMSTHISSFELHQECSTHVNISLGRDVNFLDVKLPVNRAGQKYHFPQIGHSLLVICPTGLKQWSSGRVPVSQLRGLGDPVADC